MYFIFLTDGGARPNVAGPGVTYLSYSLRSPLDGPGGVTRWVDHSKALLAIHHALSVAPRQWRKRLYACSSASRIDISTYGRQIWSEVEVRSEDVYRAKEMDWTWMNWNNRTTLFHFKLSQFSSAHFVRSVRVLRKPMFGRFSSRTICE